MLGLRRRRALPQTMPPKYLSALLPLLLAACAPTAQTPAPAPTVETPVRAQVTDLDAFNVFVATRPTPEALRGRYPGLTVVLPGDISTRELRSDHSRFFAELDAEGRVAGGQFQ